MSRKLSWLLCGVVGLTFCAPVYSQNVQQTDLDFFRGVQTGEIFGDVPEGMSRPSELSRIFAGQARFVDWAAQSEADLIRAVSRFESGEVSTSRVRCNSTICEVMLIIHGESEAVSTDVSRQFGAVAQSMNKEMTTAISTLRPGRVGVLAYLHDQGDGQ